MYYSVILLIFFASGNKFAANKISGRALFGNTYTTTVTKNQIVTSLVPSSCVQIEPTLPPCRNVRFLKLPKLPAITFNHPSNQQIVTNWKTEPKIETTALGWGEYFGFYAPTVTVTTTNLQITTVEDPFVVVTFAIRGCRPIKLPMDLDRCPRESLSTIPIKDALQTSTVISHISTTETLTPTRTHQTENLPSIFNGNPILLQREHLQDHSSILEPSHPETEEEGSSEPTEALLS